MAFKLSLKPDLEAELETLLKKTSFRSKTDYINQAVSEFNKHIKRSLMVEKLKTYFQKYDSEAKKALQEFSQVRRHGN